MASICRCVCVFVDVCFFFMNMQIDVCQLPKHKLHAYSLCVRFHIGLQFKYVPPKTTIHSLKYINKTSCFANDSYT